MCSGFEVSDTHVSEGELDMYIPSEEENSEKEKEEEA